MAGLNRLSAAQVKNAKPGKHCDGGGLYFVKRPDGGGQWVYRYTLNSKQREMGLGSESDLSLKSAREAAEKWRSVRKSGRDPMSIRDSERVETSLTTSSLEILAKETFEARKAEQKG